MPEEIYLSGCPRVWRSPISFFVPFLCQLPLLHTLAMLDNVHFHSRERKQRYQLTCVKTCPRMKNNKELRSDKNPKVKTRTEKEQIQKGVRTTDESNVQSYIDLLRRRVATLMFS